MTYTPVYRKYGDRGKVKLYQEKSERHIHSVEHSIRQLSCDKGSLFSWGSSEPSFIKASALPWAYPTQSLQVVMVGTRAQWPHGLLCPWNFPGKNTRVGCYLLLPGIFPTQGLNLHLLGLLFLWVGSLPVKPPRYLISFNIWSGSSSSTLDQI